MTIFLKYISNVLNIHKTCTREIRYSIIVIVMSILKPYYINLIVRQIDISSVFLNSVSGLLLNFYNTASNFIVRIKFLLLNFNTTQNFLLCLIML